MKELNSHVIPAIPFTSEMMKKYTILIPDMVHIHFRMLENVFKSPWLIAGYRVLLRLSVPRHSPYALFRLNSRLDSLYLRK